jgi:hypothetical protein
MTIFIQVNYVSLNKEKVILSSHKNFILIEMDRNSRIPHQNKGKIEENK